MSSILHAKTSPEPRPAEEEEFYGWRYKPVVGPDGTTTYQEVPLTKEDLLFPEEGDQIVYPHIHTRDFKYCLGTIEMIYRHEPTVAVVGDLRVDFGVDWLRPLGPDVLVLFGIRVPLAEWERAETYRLADLGGTPILAIEIASPSTHDNDLGIKQEFYYRLGLQLYVIVDRGPKGDQPTRLLGYRRGPQSWLPLAPDDQGRLNLHPVPLLLGVENDRPWLYDTRTGQRLPDLPEAFERTEEAQSKARDAEAKAHNAEGIARDAEAKARDLEAKLGQEAQIRAELEKRLRELEEQLRAQKGSENG